MAAVANKGTVNQLTLLKKTTDANGKLIKQYEQKVVNTMDSVSEETWSLVHQGMELMIDKSTVFNSLDISMAGKTGTAQQSAVHPDHALFIGYAPAENPEIAVAVRIANGYASTYPSEIGRDIVKAWYHLAPVEELVQGQADQINTNVVSGD